MNGMCSVSHQEGLQRVPLETRGLPTNNREACKLGVDGLVNCETAVEFASDGQGKLASERISLCAVLLCLIASVALRIGPSNKCAR